MTQKNKRKMYRRLLQDRTEGGWEEYTVYMGESSMVGSG